MPIHWGTFSLAQHTWTEPLSRIQALNDPDLVMLTPKHGQRIEVHKDAVTAAWCERHSLQLRKNPYGLQAMSRDNETLDFSINRAQLVHDCVNSGRSLIDIAEEHGVSVEDLQRWVAEAVQTNTIDLNLNAEQTIDLRLPSDDTHTEQDHSPNSGDHPLHDFGAVLGEGGMGRVIEATQSRLLRRVAVKYCVRVWTHRPDSPAGSRSLHHWHA